jgi:FecR protein
MHTPSPSKVSFLLLALATLCAALSVPVFADSQARIVRLSDVQGAVQIDKNTGLGYESAFVNLPITQGTRLRTGANGRAEIEFEDGSSMRVAPNTTIEFDRLGLNDSGKRVSGVNLADGMAYVNWLGKDDFSLNFAHEKVSLDRAAHFRVDASSQVANLAVFKGDVNVEGPNGQLSVEKKKTATFDIADNDKSKIENKIAEQPLDSWDKEATSYHDQYAKNSNNSPYGYGLSDLNYYGAYTNVPGYGMLWQPYFAGVGWDPFMNGAWGFYPGFGYMFASAYPWGWLPYRYGNWMFVPGFGWMWQPGMWTSFVAVPRYTPTTLTRVTTLTPPATGTMKTVTVGKVGTSTMMSSRMTVNSGSAGMGIARGSVDNLSHLNHQVAKSGSAELRPAAPFSATPAGRSSSPTYGPARTSSSMPSSTGHSAPASHSSGGGSPHH